MQRIAFQAIGVLFGVVASLVTLEVAVRILLPGKYWEFRDATDDWQLDSRLGWTQRGNLNVSTRIDSEWIEFKTNADGLLPPNAQYNKRTRHTARILMLGDSTVVGRAVPEQSRVHHQLELALAKRGIPAEVMNAGVQGYSTDQELLRLEQLVPTYTPDIVIVAVCTNDFGQNYVDQASGINKPHFELQRNGGLRYFPPDPQTRISRLGTGLSATLQRSALYRAIQPALLRLRAQVGGWENRNMLGLASDVYYSREAFDKVGFELFEALLTRMHVSSASVGARFYFYLHPAVEEVWLPFIADSIRQAGIPPNRYDPYVYERKMREIASRNELRFIPQISEFRSRPNDGPFHLLPRDPHCNATCYKITAAILADQIALDLK